MSLSDMPNELAERGIWWQVVGFAVVGAASVAVLQVWEGADFWLYRSFEIAAKDLYWLFVLPLAGMFEGARKMFEKASEIRAAQRAKMVARALDRGRKEGRKEGREAVMEEVRSRLQSSATYTDPETGAITFTLTPEDHTFLLGQAADDDK